MCLPGLHLSLGIFDQRELLEGACTELDLLLAEHISGGGEGDTYQQYAAALRKREQLKFTRASEEQHATMLEQLVTLFSPDPSQSKSLATIREESGLTSMLW